MIPTVLLSFTKGPSTLAMSREQLRQALLADRRGLFWPERNPLPGVVHGHARDLWTGNLASDEPLPERYTLAGFLWEGERAARESTLRRFAALTTGEARIGLVLGDGTTRTYRIRDGRLTRLVKRSREKTLAAEVARLREELAVVQAFRVTAAGPAPLDGETRATHVLGIVTPDGRGVVRRVALTPDVPATEVDEVVLAALRPFLRGHREALDARVRFTPIDPLGWWLACQNAQGKATPEQDGGAKTLSPAAVVEMGTAPTLPPEAPESAPSAPATPAVSSQSGLPPVLAPACVGGQQTVRADLYPTSSSRKTAPGGEPEGFHLMLLDFEDEMPPAPAKPTPQTAPMSPGTPPAPPPPVSATTEVLRATLRDPKAAHSTKTRTACLLALHDDEMSRGAIVREVRQLYPAATVEQVHGALAALVQDGFVREQGGVYEIRTRG